MPSTLTVNDQSLVTPERVTGPFDLLLLLLQQQWSGLPQTGWEQQPSPPAMPQIKRDTTPDTSTKNGTISGQPGPDNLFTVALSGCDVRHIL